MRSINGAFSVRLMNAILSQGLSIFVYLTQQQQQQQGVDDSHDSWKTLHRCLCC